MSDRMEQITRVDTASLMTTIRDIESHLSEYSRFDKLPPWAASMMSRLERVEEDNMNLRRNMGQAKPTPTSTSTPTPSAEAKLNIDDLSKDDRILAKLRVEMDSQISTTRINMDSQMASLNMEMDRMHKLLQIRPTTSELQVVVMSVHDMNKKMQLFLHDISASIRSAVQEKVAEELSTILDHIKDHEAINEECIAHLTERLNRANHDMSNLRQAVEGGLDSMQDKMTTMEGSVKANQQEMQEQKEAFEAEAAKTEQAMEEFKFHEEMTAQEFLAFRTAQAKTDDNLERQLAVQHARSDSIMEEVTQRHGETLETIDSLNSTFTEFKAQYDFDVENSTEKHQKLVFDMTELHRNFVETQSYVNSLKQIDSLQKILEMEERLKQAVRTLEVQVESLKHSEKKFDLIFTNEKVTEKSLEKLVKQSEEQAAQLKETVSELHKMGLKIDDTESGLRISNEKIEALVNLRDEVAVITELCAGTENRVKSIQVSLHSIMETADDHDERIERISLGVEQAEEEAVKKMEQMRTFLIDMLTEKQAEIDAAVQIMKDNMDTLTTAATTTKSQTAMKRRGGFFDKDGMGNIPELPGLAMSDEDQRELASHNAKFIADLCMNFEEIAVRKTFVPEIPPLMCEHLTATAQALTAFIAVCTDADTVQRILRAPPGTADFDDDEPITEKRQKRLENFVTMVLDIVTTNKPQPGIIRLDARDRFVKQLRKALSICMTKHDQVLVIGSSRFGRIKIPSCVACDRPLLDKMRQMDSVSRPDDNMLRSSSMADESQDAMRLSASKPPTGNKQLNTLRVPTPGISRGDRRGGGNRSSSSSLSSADELQSQGQSFGSQGQGQAQAYVLRGGFRLPRPSSSGQPLSIGGFSSAPDSR